MQTARSFQAKSRLCHAGPALLLVAAWLLAANFSLAVESWTDARLPVTNGLLLWFDASRQNAARGAQQFPPLTDGTACDYWFDGSGHECHLSQRIVAFRPRFHQTFTAALLHFDGQDDFLAASKPPSMYTNATVFILAAPRANPGDFRAFFAFNQAGRNDYTTGLNLDFGPFPTPQFSFLNAEGAGFGGAVNLMPSARFGFGGWHSFAVTCQPGANGVKLFVDGQPQGSRDRAESVLRLDEFTLGARCYSNTPEPPHTQGFLECDIAEFIAFNRLLAEGERAEVEKYLAAKYAALRALPPASPAEGSHPLVTVTNAPPVQMFVPGFGVRELPVKLPNINNVKYRADGKLVALGYNGQIYLLSDTDGDGLEDKVELWWETNSLRAPIGMALTPPGYAHGQGVFVAAKGKLSLIVDTNGDDRADREIIIAQGWQELPHGVDALGVALDRAGNVYFGLGCASFTDPYLVDKATGQARYDVRSERGAILKVAPDFQRREIFCTGIRFSVGMAFNRNGDLFCTDQEGATWLPNGNPLDELLHLEAGRHYGFPPRHPRHLPSVIDEPSVFDYAPQHQSACGLNFNEPVNGGPTFGPAWWAGDALVCGYSRGKLFRTKLARTAAGYVAQNSLIACLNALTVDACVSPGGDLVVATHSGAPDWGSGPNGIGTLYKLSYTAKDAPQPVIAWSANPTEIHIAFDRPLDPLQLRNLAKLTAIIQGKYVSAGDRFETLRPGYQAVHDQLDTPRYEVPVLSANLAADRRTIVLVTPPRTAALNCAITLPGIGRNSGAASDALPQHGAIDLSSDLNGVEARWEEEPGKSRWSGWLPHLDLEVCRALLQGSAEHDPLWPLLAGSGWLVLRGQLDLWQMLQPAIQPGAKLDYERSPEDVIVRFAAAAEIHATFGTNRAAPFGKDGEMFVARLASRPQENRWIPFELKIRGNHAAPSLQVSWSAAEGPQRSRPLPLRRILLPWATPKLEAAPANANRQLPELAGGNWLRGKGVFFGDTVACYKCHQVRGQGGRAGPDLSNLIYRDYGSVLKDIRDPNAAINPDHVAYNVELIDGDLQTGVLQSDTPELLTLADASGQTLSVARSRIKSLKPSPVSLMPEGLDKGLAAGQLKDLMTFLLTSPLDPAPLESQGAPSARPRAELDAALKASRSKPENIYPLNIVLCAGPKDHGSGEHDYPLWQGRWEKLLSLADGVTASTAQGWPSPEQWRSAQVIVFYSNNPGWNSARGKQLDAFLERGGGLVYLHWAVEGHQAVEALAQRIGLAWRDGFSKFRHGPLELKLHPHPLAAGLGALRLVDESYWQLVGDARDLQLIASGVEEGEERPLIWTRSAGEGRIFVSIPGHFTWTFDDPLFRLLLLRGICWAGHQPLDRLAELAAIGARISE